MLTSPMYIQTQYNGLFANGCLFTGRVSLLEMMTLSVISIFSIYRRPFGKLSDSPGTASRDHFGDWQQPTEPFRLRHR
jgi:hypothetical protein